MERKFGWLLKSDEVEFEQHKFKGKLAGKAWSYSRNIDGLIRTRLVIFAMALLVFYPILTNYAFHGIFIPELLIERVIYALVFIAAGLLFNKIRIVAVILAAIPLVLMLFTYLFIAPQFSSSRVGFLGAILLLILSGIYHHLKLKKLRQELEANLLENQLID